MRQSAAAGAEPRPPGPLIEKLVERDGTAAHPYASGAALTGDGEALRNLADAAHCLCMLHGRHPGLIDVAAERVAEPATRGWIATAVEGFARERLFLANLAAAAGPLPSTPGHAESEAAVLGQRHALETLARSERRGCAFGAAAALLLDWRAIRAVLDTAADRLAVEAPPLALPGVEQTRRVAAAFGDGPAVRRAIGFGAEQVLVQHRGLWDLLDARRAAREEW